MERKQDILKTKYHKVHDIANLKDMLEKSLSRYGNQTAFKLKKENDKIYNVTYRKLKEDVWALGTAFINDGLKDQAICIIGKNSYSWIVSYLAASIVGIVVPIDKELHSHDIVNFIENCESKTVVCDDKYIPLILEESKNTEKNIKFINIDNKNTKNSIPFNSIIESGYKRIESGDNFFDNITINPDDMHILLYTSGTTGTSKGICLSHKNICSNIMSVAKIVKVDKKVTVLSILPVHHTYECTLGHLLLLYGGGTITYCDGLRYINKNIEEYKPSFIICVPLLLENIHKKIMKTLEKSLPEKYFKTDKHFMDSMPGFLRMIVKSKIKKSLGGRISTFIVGAAAIDPNLVESFFKFGLRTLQGYGLTECSPLVAGNNDFFQNYASAGLPIPDVEFKIDNPDENGNGEIIVKGPNVMLGYYKNPEETNKVIKDGWFYTGDIGHIDEDGFLFITGRCKSVIVTENGKNIYPEEIEYYLNNDPLIAESIVIGSKNETSDRTYVNAKILPDLDMFKEIFHKASVTASDIQKEIKRIVSEINAKLPNYKHIKNFKIVKEEFEKTTTKKIKRFGKNTEK